MWNLVEDGEWSISKNGQLNYNDSPFFFFFLFFHFRIYKHWTMFNINTTNETLL